MDQSEISKLTGHRKSNIRKLAEKNRDGIVHIGKLQKKGELGVDWNDEADKLEFIERYGKVLYSKYVSWQFEFNVYTADLILHIVLKDGVEEANEMITRMRRSKSGLDEIKIHPEAFKRRTGRKYSDVERELSKPKKGRKSSKTKRRNHEMSFAKDYSSVVG